MHVPMCGPHKHTHNVQYGAFEEWSLTEPQHQPVKRTLPSPMNRQFGPRPRGPAEGGGGAHTTYWGRLALRALGKKNNTVKHLTYPDCWLDRLTETGGGFL